ncbi:MAG: hypothetical protein K1X89_18300 [Myxococcaceae bacterium]|nr:hypothetical protein [Myxococcaceae bacterium]
MPAPDAGPPAIVAPARAPAPLPELRFHGVGGADLEALRHRVEAALSFAVSRGEWSQPRRLMKDPLEVEVTELPRGTLAAASGPRRFSVSPAALSEARADGVLAHELTHVLDFRAAGPALAQLPRFLEEGRALSVGHAWRALAQEPADDAARASQLRALTAEDGAEALRLFRDGAGLAIAKERGLVGRFMSVGVFFLEYLRVRGGASDAFARLSRVLERLGAGTAFDAAFVEQFGRPLAEFEREFVAFLRSTASDPAERMRGTVYAAPAR